MVSFSGDSVDIQLTFFSPIHISAGIEADTLIVHIKNSTYVICPSETFFLESQTFSSIIPRQMVNSVATQSFKESLGNTNTSLKYIFIIALMFNVFMNEKMMKYMMFLIRPLQLILHMPLFRIVLPSNFSMLNNIIAPIMMFDILSNDKGWDVSLVLEYDESQGAASIMDQMKNIGYTSNNCSNNLGTMYLTLVTYLMQVIFTVFLAIIYKTTGKGEKLFRKM